MASRFNAKVDEGQMIKLNADPVFLIYFAKGTKGLSSKLGLGDFGTPIPIYLSEKLTGLYVDTDKYALGISTDWIVKVKKDNKGNILERGDLTVQQKGETQTCDITLIGRRDSVGLNLLLPMLQTIYSNVVAVKDYRIAYFHNNILIFDARLASLNTNQTRENDLISIDITLEVSPEQEKDETKEPVQKLGFEGNQVQVQAGA